MTKVNTSGIVQGMFVYNYTSLKITNLKKMWFGRNRLSDDFDMNLYIDHDSWVKFVDTIVAEKDSKRRFAKISIEFTDENEK